MSTPEQYRHDAGEPRHARRRRTAPIIASIVFAAAALTAGTALAYRTLDTPTPPVPPAASGPAHTHDTTGPAPTTGPPALTYPADGPGTYTTTGDTGPIRGHAGTLLRYHVAIENGLTQIDPTTVTTLIDTTYNDPRGWTSAGAWRFQRVAATQPADLTIYLVTPGTRAKLCGDPTDHYTNCRTGDKIILNVARWAHATPDYGGSLDIYRQYALNHETGHRLGFDHELCPAPGTAAPVMQQQTLGLHGCAANAWPYPVKGIRNAGTPGEYPDPIPAG
ncbi:hypothetical protein Lfu02_07780 [Longispora fulva]|uniref:DUF3152 domain-containing protein n=1 Tax=Longispora fulva TaxID=619741 RepID=A0A8J7GA24_9ACTN|nr:DUF3152 domain-containing protein [Longispora fulva]MBG6135355.1 hypothetical protein [Longispora fulva]GIG56406.1 hypothetical protein Lfu02_07780 [Longispora fulva]